MHKITVKDRKTIAFSDLTLGQVFTWGKRHTWYLKVGECFFIDLRALKNVTIINDHTAPTEVVLGNISEIIID